MNFTSGVGCCAELGREQQGIQCRAGPGAAVQLCLSTINLSRGTTAVKTLGLLIKCFAPQEWGVISCSPSPKDTDLFVSWGHQGLFI